jgi:hypothetical protein
MERGSLNLDPDQALSGRRGLVEGRRRRLRARLGDLLDDGAAWLRLVPPRLARSAADGRGSVRVLGIYAEDHAASMARAVAELRRSRREVAATLGALDAPAPALAGETLLSGLRAGGKFENLNALLAERPLDGEGTDWLIAIDDDVELPRGFLDRFLFLAERFGLVLAQPALRRTSHTAWPVFRRERWSVVRATRMVEIGPLTAFAEPARDELLPFPPLRMGWGLDSHWGALALERGWRLGVVDATPIRHESRRIAASYDAAEAAEELRSFLRGRPHLDRITANSVIERHRSW